MQTPRWSQKNSLLHTGRHKSMLTKRSPIELLTARCAAWLWWSLEPRTERVPNAPVSVFFFFKLFDLYICQFHDICLSVRGYTNFVADFCGVKVEGSLYCGKSMYEECVCLETELNSDAPSLVHTLFFFFPYFCREAPGVYQSTSGALGTNYIYVCVSYFSSTYKRPLSCVQASPRGNRTEPKLHCFSRPGNLLWVLESSTLSSPPFSLLECFRPSCLCAHICKNLDLSAIQENRTLSKSLCVHPSPYEISSDRHARRLFHSIPILFKRRQLVCEWTKVYNQLIFNFKTMKFAINANAIRYTHRRRRKLTKIGF